ncbi:MAG: hypothetical protein H6809_01640 [Phycisphaeraceae bacterium]|nr:hypothetical protein [Phycisphaeraceae bacterium]
MNATPPNPQPTRSVHTADARYRLDLFDTGATVPGAYARPIPTYHLVLVRLADNRTIADTRRASRTARIVSRDAMLIEIDLAGDEVAAIDLHTSTCGLENYRGPTGPTLPLDRFASLLR